MTIPPPRQRIHLLAGPEGSRRRARLEELLAELPGRRRIDDARLAQGGVWGPLAAWFRDLLPSLQEEMPELLARRRRELALILPDLREPADTSRSLAESAGGGRRVRMFAADRVHRSIHGIVEVLGEHLRRQGGAWAIGWDGFDQAGALSRRSLFELLQRFGESADLRLVLTVSNEEAAKTIEEIARHCGAEPVMLPLAAGGGAADESGESPAAWAARAAEIASRLTQRLGPDQPLLFQLADCWERAGDRPRLEATLARLAICLNRLNYYQDALPIVRRVVPFALAVYVGEPDRQSQLLIALYGVLVATGNPGEAVDLLERAVPAVQDGPEKAAALQYMLAMLRARYLPQLDLARAQAHLERAIALTAAGGAAEDERRFQQAFFRNGLALVHYRRGDTAAALRLCEENLAALDAEFAAGEQLLFCSILYQNLALVQVARGGYREAYRAYSKAIEIDPAYPEYYNDRGSLALKNGRPELALADYLRAVEIGPPFAEAFANLGQAYRALGRLPEAAAAYAHALELEPALQLARIGRAQTRRLAGDDEGALEDYDHLLAGNPPEPLLWANRGAIRYGRQNFTAALADFGRALELAPELPALHRNRALVLEALGRRAEAEEARARAGLLESAATAPAATPPPVVMDSAEFHAGPPQL